MANNLLNGFNDGLHRSSGVGGEKFDYSIDLSQRKIIEAIEHELSLEDEFYKPKGMFHSVWFLPECGMFMYADCLVRHEVILPLIENKTLVFKGIEQHQGEPMPRYVLSSANGS
mgnify:FL=1